MVENKEFSDSRVTLKIEYLDSRVALTQTT